MLEGCAPAVRGGLSFSAVLSSTLSAYACHLRGALPAHWACRVFSGPWGIVVVRASWSGHPTLIKKKKDIQLLQFRIHHPSISSMNSATNSNIDISWWILNKTAFTMSVEEGTSSLLQSPTPSEFILIHSILNSISRSTVYYSDCFIFVILKNWLLILF
jgi:hypothetical protein